MKDGGTEWERASRTTGNVLGEVSTHGRRGLTVDGKFTTSGFVKFVFDQSKKQKIMLITGGCRRKKDDDKFPEDGWVTLRGRAAGPTRQYIQGFEWKELPALTFANGQRQGTPIMYSSLLLLYVLYFELVFKFHC